MAINRYRGGRRHVRLLLKNSFGTCRNIILIRILFSACTGASLLVVSGVGGSMSSVDLLSTRWLRPSPKRREERFAQRESFPPVTVVVESKAFAPPFTPTPPPYATSVAASEWFAPHYALVPVGKTAIKLRPKDKTIHEQRRGSPWSSSRSHIIVPERLPVNSLLWNMSTKQ